MNSSVTEQNLLLLWVSLLPGGLALHPTLSWLQNIAAELAFKTAHK